MHFASDMMNLRHEIDLLRRDRRKMVERLRRFGSALQSDTAKMLAAMRKAMHEEHGKMRELRGERARARRNFMGKKA